MVINNGAVAWHVLHGQESDGSGVFACLGALIVFVAIVVAVYFKVNQPRKP